MIDNSITYTQCFCNHLGKYFILFFYKTEHVFLLYHSVSLLSTKNNIRAAEAALCRYLLLHDLQDLHGASLDADATCNTLTGGIALLQYHDLHGADLHALATGNTQLLVDHVNAGLGILGDRTMLASLFTLAALDTGHGLCATALRNHLDAGIIRIEFFVEGIGACANALQTSHTFRSFFHSEFLHNRGLSFM